MLIESGPTCRPTVVRRVTEEGAEEEARDKVFVIFGKG